MKLLLAGDSFAELAGYVGHIQTEYNQPVDYSRPGDSIHIKHWVELLADDINAEIVPHGLGGAGISLTSFIAMQQLIKTTYDGLIFFVSHHGRAVVNNVSNIREWGSFALHDVAWDQPFESSGPGSGVEVYRNNAMYTDQGKVRNISSEDFVVSVLDDQHGVQHQHAVQQQMAPLSFNYLLGKPGYSYIHDSVTAVITLKSYCAAHNIPVVFVSAFPNGACEAVQDLGIDLKHFSLDAAERKYNFTAQDNVPTHYFNDDHKCLYTEFKQLYPEYKTMFNTNS